jgi:hypothetical protein
MPGAAVVAIAGDLHINSTVGLCPPTVALDDGGTFHASKAQRWIWRCWLDYWERVGKSDSPIYVVLNGDLVEGLHHRTTQLVTHNEETQLAMALQVLEPVARLADYLFIVRGTEAHTGPSAQWEEHLADDLSAVRDTVGLTASWWHLPLEVEGVTFDICHHPQTGSQRPWTLDQAAARQAAITWDEYQEMGQKPPDVVIRSHRHVFGRGYRDDTLSVFCPSWQITTAFGRRLGTGRRVQPIGGLVFQCQDGRYTWSDQRYRPIPRKPWTSPKTS